MPCDGPKRCNECGQWREPDMGLDAEVPDDLVAVGRGHSLAPYPLNPATRGHARLKPHPLPVDVQYGKGKLEPVVASSPEEGVVHTREQYVNPHWMQDMFKQVQAMMGWYDILPPPLPTLADDEDTTEQPAPPAMPEYKPEPIPERYKLGSYRGGFQLVTQVSTGYAKWLSSSSIERCRIGITYEYDQDEMALEFYDADAYFAPEKHDG